VVSAKISDSSASAHNGRIHLDFFCLALHSEERVSTPGQGVDPNVYNDECSRRATKRRLPEPVSLFRTWRPPKDHIGVPRPFFFFFFFALRKAYQGASTAMLRTLRPRHERQQPAPAHVPHHHDYVILENCWLSSRIALPFFYRGVCFDANGERPPMSSAKTRALHLNHSTLANAMVANPLTPKRSGLPQRPVLAMRPAPPSPGGAAVQKPSFLSAVC